MEAGHEWTEPATGMRFVAIPHGVFVAGSPLGEAGREAGETAHQVTLTGNFWLGAFEVTQAEWARVMGSNPSHFHSADGRLPVEQISWFEVQDFLRRLAVVSAGNTFRLPTEAEWEYACRAGSATAYATGSRLTTADANINSDASVRPADRGGTRSVGSFQPNAWGLYDMHGNVWEWTSDEICAYPSPPVVDPRGVCGSGLKVIRGGSWHFTADSARCALRYTHRPQDRGFSLGFRVVREAQDKHTGA